MISLRRAPVVVALVAALGCSPSAPNTPLPTPPGASGPAVDYAVFDPSANPPAIPLPNDLALQPSSIATQTGAQKELLTLFAAKGGFPNDQEVPITIDFQRQEIDPKSGAATKVPLEMDPASFKQGAFAVVEVSPQGVIAPAAIDPITAADFVPHGTVTTLSVHHVADPVTHSRAWNPGHRYLVGVRSGPDGVKTAAGGEVHPMPAMYLITRELPLTSPAFDPLIPGATAAEKVATAQRLEALRQSYTTAFAALAAAGGIPTKELADIQTFQIAPASVGGAVVTDASAGVVPLPSDLLLDPANGGKTIVENASFGPLAKGIATLDGFSTTAMILSQTSAPVVAATVNKDTVFLYDLSNPAQPLRVKEAREAVSGTGFVAEPYLITMKADGTTPCGPTDNPAGCFSTAIGLQPATLLSASPLVSVPPLKEKTEYAVLITNGVLVAPSTPTGSPTPLQRSTLSSLLLFESPLVDASGKSQVSGQDDATAAGLEKIRQGVGVAIQALQAEKGASFDRSKVVLGYTFRTQSVSEVALQLAAAPYQPAVAPNMVPQSATPMPIASLPAGVPTAGIAAIYAVTVPTLDPIDRATGALAPDPATWRPSALNALVVAPNPGGAVQEACPAPASALSCAPLVVFQHGLGQNKTNVFAIASTLASAGFAVAAIDAPLHGDRALCTVDTECVCPAGVTCTPTCTLFASAPLPGDAAPVGLCETPSVAVPGVSGNYFVTLNLFRTRDALRQDILDTSALVLALAPPAPTANPVAQAMQGHGLAIDGRKVYWLGQSLGGILGTLNTAANPRISRAVLNVPGATLTDVFTNSPAFSTAVGALLAGVPPPLGPITPGSANYLRFIQVTKLVLDGADPANYARHLVGDADHPTWPNLLTQAPNQAAKNVFGQYAICDQVIPNPYNLFLFDQIGLSAGSAPNPFSAYAVVGAGTPPSCTTTNNPAHGFLLAPTNATAAGQGDASAYLSTLAVPAASRP